MHFLKTSCIALLFLSFISVGSARAACSNATVAGVWGFLIGAAAGQFTADGKGNITNGTQTASNSGVISTDTFTGTYTVASNCTGTVSLTYNGGAGTAKVNIVAFNGNHSVQAIDLTAGAVASGFVTSEGTVTCGLTGVKKTFAADLFGKIVTTGPVGYVAQVILDGHGNVSGSGTFDVNGKYTIDTISGTYTESSSCTGTLTMTPQGGSTLHFKFVVVNSGKELLLVETDAHTAVIGTMQQ